MRTATERIRQSRRRSNFFWVLMLLLLISAFATCGMVQPEKELVIVTHTVVSGETLWAIAGQYLQPDRYILEFMEGIYELNYDRVFMEREQKGTPRKAVFPGDQLEIRYWRVKQ